MISPCIAAALGCLLRYAVTCRAGRTSSMISSFSFRRSVAALQFYRVHSGHRSGSVDWQAVGGGIGGRAALLKSGYQVSTFWVCCIDGPGIIFRKPLFAKFANRIHFEFTASSSRALPPRPSATSAVRLSCFAARSLCPCDTLPAPTVRTPAAWSQSTGAVCTPVAQLTKPPPSGLRYSTGSNSVYCDLFKGSYLLLISARGRGPAFLQT
eukprot:GHVT01078701.1.p1 GENE.GHVT01078701.1~~GHVT01078701.1.p1  ORF type:complete len:210 (+),score=19.27 GHVT01078701.1:1625-2254(+)